MVPKILLAWLPKLVTWPGTSPDLSLGRNDVVLSELEKFMTRHRATGSHSYTILHCPHILPVQAVLPLQSLHVQVQVQSTASTRADMGMGCYALTSSFYSRSILEHACTPLSDDPRTMFSHVQSSKVTDINSATGSGRQLSFGFQSSRPGSCSKLRGETWSAQEHRQQGWLIVQALPSMRVR